VPKALDRDAAKGTFSIQYSINEFEADYKAYKDLVRNGDEASLVLARTFRDSMIDRIRVDVEMNYREYEARIFIGRATGDSIADFLELGLALATTITNGERAKTVLGAVSTAFKGNRLSLDKNFFREKTIETIISKMQGTREKVKTRILQNMLQAPVKSYSFEAAWTDLVEYFYAGTLEGAIQALAVDAGADAAQAKAKTQDIEQLRIASVDELTQIQKINDEEIKLETAWLAAQTDHSAQAISAAKDAVTKARAALKALQPDVSDTLPEREVFVTLRKKISESLNDRSKLIKLMQAFGLIK
jgi:hypothetical protein